MNVLRITGRRGSSLIARWAILTAASFATGCQGVPVAIGTLPSDVERLLGAAESLAGMLLFHNNLLPKQYVFFVDYGLSESASPAVAKVWGRIFTDIFANLTQDTSSRKELELLTDRIREYVDHTRLALAIGAPASPCLGGFTRYLQELDHTKEGRDFLQSARRMFDTTTQQCTRLWESDPTRFGYLIAGFEESVLGVGLQPQTSTRPRWAATDPNPAPLTVEIRQTGLHAIVTQFWAEYRDTMRIREKGNPLLREPWAAFATMSAAQLRVAWRTVTEDTDFDANKAMPSFQIRAGNASPQPIRVADALAGTPITLPIHQVYSIPLPGAGFSLASIEFSLELQLGWDLSGEAIWHGTIFAHMHGEPDAVAIARVVAAGVNAHGA